MKKNMTTIVDGARRDYMQPTLEVCELQPGPALLETSKEETLTIVDDEEEGWPEDPETGQPYSPW